MVTWRAVFSSLPWCWGDCGGDAAWRGVRGRAGGIGGGGCPVYAGHAVPAVHGLLQEAGTTRTRTASRWSGPSPECLWAATFSSTSATTTGQPIKVTDLTVEGVKLSEGLAQTSLPKTPDVRFQASILLSELPKDQIEKLKSAGTPVWWKPEPNELPAGGIGEIVMRMRRDPKIGRFTSAL